MLQDFRRRTTPDTGPPRLAALRAAMAEAHVDAFLVPRADAHQGESVPPRDERLAWLTSFTGSAGVAAVTRERASIFVDGRYRLQVAAEVATGAFEIRRHPEEKLADWLAEALPDGGRVGFDPWLHTARDIDALQEALTPRRIELARTGNLIDRIWPDQPPPPRAPIVVHPAHLAGRTSADKRALLAAELASHDLAAAIITLPDSLAWLLNIRGGDIARTPVALAFGILHRDGRVSLFVEEAELGPEVRAHLGPDVALQPPEALAHALAGLAGRVGVDRDTAPLWISDRIAEGQAQRVWLRDPCVLAKAQKTPAEIGGAREAHLRDGAAMAGFLAWLERTAPDGRLSEIDIVRELEGRRRATGVLRDIAFETICGGGPNGAIVHYRVSEATNRRIGRGELLLIDSGGQYSDGTTDITRTIAIGEPDPAVRQPFTRVLKGMIAMTLLRWPEGLAGRDIEALARAPLWSGGFDYDHGTGHGVGAYLSVHEGPASLSRRSAEPLRPGMIMSNEPGYYREGAFGIRIENLMVIEPARVPEGGDRPMLSFETLTMVPIDTRLVEPRLLEGRERDWLNAYHARVRAALEPRVQAEVRTWLERACAPL